VDILIAPGSRLAARRFCAGCRALSRIREHWMPERSRFDLAALPVCGPACDGRPTKAEPVADAGPAALAHGTPASRWPVGIQLAGIRSGTDVAAQECY